MRQDLQSGTAGWALNANAAVLVVLVGWSICLAISVSTARVLYADGSHFLLSHLLRPNVFNNYDRNRLFASLITQAPLLIGDHLHVQTVSTYAALYSLGTFVLPAAGFIFSFYLARHQPVLFAVTALVIAVFGFGTNFINTEANIFFALTWVSLTCLALDGSHPVLRGVVLPLLAIVLLRVYEGIALVGPLLAVLALLQFRRSSSRLEKAGLGLAILFFLAGTAGGVNAILHPRDPSNEANFLASISVYLRNPQFLLLLASSSLLPSTLSRDSIHRAIFALLGIVFSILFLSHMVQLTNYYAYTIYYQNRAFLGLLLPASIGIMLAGKLFSPPVILAENRRLNYLIILIPFFAAVAGDLLGSFRWHQYVGEFCEVLSAAGAQNSGVEQLKKAGAVMGWSWTHPTMSILLRARGTDGMIRNEPGSRWEPFDPSTPISINYVGLCENRSRLVSR